ncbi:MAG: hypothetical protein AAGB01_00835 [Cyanobacteria bacterium P01_F01_bin.42]
MRSFDSQQLQLSFSALKPWITAFLVIWLVGALGLGWLIKSFLFLLLFLLLVPVLLLGVGRWWLSRNLVQQPCPVCGYELTGLSIVETRCPSCNEVLEIKDKAFVRPTSPGTIDVDVVDVTAQSVDD